MASHHNHPKFNQNLIAADLWKDLSLRHDVVIKFMSDVEEEIRGRTMWIKKDRKGV